MFLREAPTQTLEDVRKALDTGAEAVLVEDRNVKLNLTAADPSVKLKTVTGANIEVPANKPTLEAIGSWVQVPTAFLHRLDADLQQMVLSELLKRQAGTALVSVTDEEIEEMRSPGNRVELRSILDVASRVIAPKAPVVEWWRERGDFRLDVIAPEEMRDGRYSPDAKARKVGDITAMGVRIGMDMKHSLTPWTSTLLYRLACTNGYERLDIVSKIDGRGASSQEVLNQLEEAVEEAFSNAQREVKAFYDLRNTPVDNPERMLARIAREHELPDRTLAALVERAASDAIPDNANLFDVVNLITNTANDPSIRHKSGPRRRLEQVGGAIISEHADRCSHCKARLN